MLQENYGTTNSSLLTPNYETTHYETPNYEADEPISFLHPQLRAIINEMHDTLGHPKEFLFLSMLVAISTAMGNNYRLKHKEGWYERAILYGVIVGNAGSNKSHPMDFAMRPLIDRDLEVLREARETGDKSEVERRIVSDTTQEGLVALHYRSPQGLALFADELKSWIDNFTRYTSSSSQEQFWLSNFSAKPIFVDRKGEGGSMAIDSPFINVLGSTQPRVLRSFGVGDRGDNGFVDRLLFVIKESNQKPYWSDREPCKELIEGYHVLIRSILDDDLERYNKAPLKEHTLCLSP